MDQSIECFEIVFINLTFFGLKNVQIVVFVEKKLGYIFIKLKCRCLRSGQGVF